jgi:hypothetical protein
MLSILNSYDEIMNKLASEKQMSRKEVERMSRESELFNEGKIRKLILLVLFRVS